MERQGKCGRSSPISQHSQRAGSPDRRWGGTSALISSRNAVVADRCCPGSRRRVSGGHSSWFHSCVHRSGCVAALEHFGPDEVVYGLAHSSPDGRCLAGTPAGRHGLRQGFRGQIDVERPPERMPQRAAGWPSSWLDSGLTRPRSSGCAQTAAATSRTRYSASHRFGQRAAVADAGGAAVADGVEPSSSSAGSAGLVQVVTHHARSRARLV